MENTEAENLSTIKKDMEEVALIEKIKAGNEEAFLTVYQSHQKKLKAYAFVITDSNYMADEMVQEVFLKIWVNRKKLNSELNLRHFLFKVMRNMALNHLKKVARDQRLKNEQLLHMPTASNSTEYTVTYKEYLDIVDEVVQNLPKQKRLIYELSRHQGKSNKEIAQAMDLSVFTVKNHLGYALKAVKDKLRLVAEITLPFLPVILFS